MARLRLQLIQGMTLKTLCRVLADNRFQVRGPGWPRLAMLTGVGAVNSLLGLVERAANRRHIAASGFPQDPIFILGHWRSGTTLLHNLISCDPRFGFANQYQAMFPHHFVYSQPKGTRLLGKFTPPTRPFDQVALSMHTPQEDDFALTAMTGLGFYTRLLFPKRPAGQLNGLDLEGLPPDRRRDWEEAFRLLTKKVATKNSRAERLVLKSPAHTGRIPTLLRIFPRAKFIHLVRDPYAVFLSSRHLWEKGMAPCHLHPVDRAAVQEIILSTYCGMMELYTRHRDLIAPDNLVEVRFEDLERHPARCLRHIYEALGLCGFEQAWVPMAAHLERLAGYEKNRYQLDDEARAVVADRWGRWFEAWGYPLDPPDGAEYS